MEFEQLRQLDAIDREGTMSAAAKRLNISQPALSRSIQRLEAELRQPLFDRRGRQVAFNEAGRAALEWARQILRDERLLRDAVDEAARRARTLRVGTVAPAPLWRLTSLLVERFPRETLTSENLSSGEIERAVIDGSLDLGIVAAPCTSPLLCCCPLMRESLSVALPPNHPLASKRSVTAEDLDGNTFLLLADIGFWRAATLEALPHATFIEQRDREVFARLAPSTPHVLFTTDAPFLDDAIPGRAIVPIDAPFAHAEFFLVVSATATGVPQQFFAWIRDRYRTDIESYGKV